MARVTATEVKEILDNCVVEDSVIKTMIDAGTLVIDSVFTDDTDVGTDLLKEIERWFVAHMVASTLHRMGKEEKVGDAQIAYTGSWGMGLDSTPYGQMVKQLDITGKMSKVGKRGASMFAIPSFE
jgi:hypothetical protein